MVDYDYMGILFSIYPMVNYYLWSILYENGKKIWNTKVVKIVTTINDRE